MVEAERARTGFQFEEVFIDGDDALELEYGIRVPVIEIDGEDRFEYHVVAEEPQSWKISRASHDGSGYWTWSGPGAARTRLA